MIVSQMNARRSTSSPTGIPGAHVHSVTCTPPGWAATAGQSANVPRKLAPTTAVPSGPASRFSCGPNAQIATAPANGSSQTIRGQEFTLDSTVPLSLQERDVVHVSHRARTEEDDHDSQSDGRLGGRDGDDQEREDVPGVVQPRAGIRHERQVGGVPHQLDRHQHDQRIAPQHDTQCADEEYDGGKPRIEIRVDGHLYRYHRVTSILRSGLEIRSRVSALRRCAVVAPARTTTPTTAIKSTNAVNSNGSRYLVKSARPKSSTLPNAPGAPGVTVMAGICAAPGNTVAAPSIAPPDGFCAWNRLYPSMISAMTPTMTAGVEILPRRFGPTS